MIPRHRSKKELLACFWSSIRYFDKFYLCGRRISLAFQLHETAPLPVRQLIDQGPSTATQSPRTCAPFDHVIPKQDRASVARPHALSHPQARNLEQGRQKHHQCKERSHTASLRIFSCPEPCIVSPELNSRSRGMVLYIPNSPLPRALIVCTDSLID